jgi:hypothetical protein
MSDLPRATAAAAGRSQLRGSVRLKAASFKKMAFDEISSVLNTEEELGYGQAKDFAEQPIERGRLLQATDRARLLDGAVKRRAVAWGRSPAARQQSGDVSRRIANAEESIGARH